MNAINPNLPWTPSGQFYEMDTQASDMTFAVIGLTVETDGGRFVMIPQRGFGYPSMPGGFTMFGGHIENDEPPDTAAEREGIEELGQDFYNKVVELGGPPQPIADYHYQDPQKGNTRYRIYLMDLGIMPYEDWSEVQALICQREGIGRMGVTLESLTDDAKLPVKHLMFPADRDIVGYVLSQF